MMATILASVPSAMAANTVATPLAEAVNTPVRDCAKSETVNLPIITWGGDIATIAANGNAAQTTAGSLFDQQGLKIKLAREDVFANQLKAYLGCESPYLRGTLGMVNQAAEVANRDPRTKLVVIYQMTWSAGGDAIVAKANIKKPGDLKGKTIAVQAYGPHIDYLAKVLADAGLTMKDVNIHWTRDLTGTKDSPKAMLYEANMDAALVITPDALALTTRGTVGSGAEDSIKGAHILLTTKTANRIIGDVYAVRADYFKANRDKVERLVRGLLQAEQKLKELFNGKNTQNPEYRALLTTSATLLLDSAQATADAEAMYHDAEFAGWGGNSNFFNNKTFPRRFDVLNQEIQTALIGIGLTRQKQAIDQARWDFNALKTGLSHATLAETPRFDKDQVSRVVARRSEQEKLSEGELFSFEVFFKPNQNDFVAKDYAKEFDRAIALASTYGGAIITVEGHADPLAYSKKKSAGEPEIVLNRIRQSAKNLSMTRANAVRDSLIQYGVAKGLKLDASQFSAIGHGISKPRLGMCGADPCAPKTEQEWLSNMRVEFRLIQVEAEENVFRPQ
jgi:outer membrane protein OmpA-like peptidoglycan-associated protein